MPIIEVKHLTKEYQLGNVTSIKQTVINALKRLFFQPIKKEEPFKALDDISFSIEQGEVVGIIGQNGAGKSTLLKHLANISQPTHGTVKVHGSIAPLIEVGAGVSPELTGRENIFLNGAILGIPKKIIQQKLDDIIEFAELEEFIDTPVKRYSSGMVVKLGFSIATSLDAKILIVDEILSVGDLAFQRKCFERMEAMIKSEGKTVLVVSHNIRQILRICERVILINKGKVIKDGDPEEVCKMYFDETQNRITENHQTYKNNHIQSTGEVEVESLSLVNDDGSEIQSINSGDELSVRLVLKCNQRIEDPAIVIGTHTSDFIYLSANSTRTDRLLNILEVGIYEFVLKLDFFPLKPAMYYFRISIGSGSRVMLNGDTLLGFEVLGVKHELDLPPNRNLELQGTWTVKLK